MTTLPPPSDEAPLTLYLEAHQHFGGVRGRHVPVFDGWLYPSGYAQALESRCS